MTAVDTSIVVAAFAAWHEAHRTALAALRRSPRLPVHVAVETYSVLTRLPPPHRAAPDLVVEFLEARFPHPPLALPGEEVLHLVRRALSADIAGGAVYDAVVGETARRAGATLLTRDHRAVRVYETLGVAYELVG